MTSATLLILVFASQRGNQVALRLEVQVITHKRQKHGPWLEGSLLGQAPEFRSYCDTKAEYDEIGPSIVRFDLPIKTEIIGKPGWQSLHITPVL